ncbi:MAG: hypothetical protein R3A79_30070 [Nannocystaceae bacterium]
MSAPRAPEAAPAARLARPTRLARVALALLLGLAAVEWAAAARAYRATLTPAAWAALDARVAALLADSPDELLLLADPWLGPRGRQAIAALTDPRALAPHDLHGAPRFTIITRGGDPWARAWLREAWGARPLPRAAEVLDVGPFTLHRFEVAAAAVTFDLLAAVDAGAAVQVSDERGRCRGRGGVYTCAFGQVLREYVEIAYRPRRCLAFAVEGGVPIRLDLPRAALGERLRGHLGFTDYNARIRGDAPARVEIAVDGRRRAALTISDRQGWAAFEVATPPGAHDVSVTVTPGLSGTWGDGGYDSRPTRRPCLELRALTGGAP